MTGISLLLVSPPTNKTPNILTILLWAIEVGLCIVLFPRLTTSDSLETEAVCWVKSRLKRTGLEWKRAE